MNLRLTLLEKAHNKTVFDCGKEILNNYLQKQVNQDVKRKLAVCFVLIDDNNLVKGYYTLSNSSILQSEIPPNISKKLPNAYTNIPVTLLGRLAIDKTIIKKGQGEFLLIDALKQSYLVSKNAIGSLAVIVDPIDETAVLFYKKYGFIMLPDSGKMFLSMNTITQLFPDI